jgi:cell division protein FtsL
MSVVWQQSTHGVQRRQERLNQVATKTIVVGALVATVLIGAYLALGALNVRLSREVWSLHKELAEQQREISWLETEVARLSSIPVLQIRSVEQGYAPAESIEYIELGAP